MKESIENTEKFSYEINPLKAIRKKCIEDCCVGQKSEVYKCQCKKCFLYPFRYGTNPFIEKSL